MFHIFEIKQRRHVHPPCLQINCHHHFNLEKSMTTIRQSTHILSKKGKLTNREHIEMEVDMMKVGV